MTKSLKTRVDALIQEHGAYRIKDAARSAMKGNRDPLRALQLDDCYSLELREILEMVDGRQQYDPAAELREAFL